MEFSQRFKPLSFKSNLCNVSECLFKAADNFVSCGRFPDQLGHLLALDGPRVHHYVSLYPPHNVK